MAVSRDWMRQVRDVMEEIQPGPPRVASPESEAWQRYDFNNQLLDAIPIEQTPRARDIREINRIATYRSWQSEVAAAVDRAGASGLNAMEDHELHDLAAHMRRLVDCAHNGCDLADDFPAR